jgi:hypothetical protein
MLKILSDMMSKIKGVNIKTPIVDFSIDTNKSDKYLKSSFSLGYDLNLLQYLALLSAGKADIEAYNSQRILIEESAKQIGFSLDIPVSVVKMSPKEAYDQFRKLIQETSARLQAIKESYLIPFSLGRWLSDTLSCTAMAQSVPSNEIPNLFLPVINRFEQARSAAQELGASTAIIKSLSELRDKLSYLSKQSSIKPNHYSEIFEKSSTIFHKLMEQFS